MARALLIGLARSGVAVTRRLQAEGTEVVAVDDSAAPGTLASAAELGIELIVRPERAELAKLAAGSDLVVPSPGVPASHPVFSLDLGRKLISEVELAYERARCPVVAVTGTNGKTTVVTMVERMLSASNIPARAAGNIGRPLIEAVDDQGIEVLVAEVSSFQLALTRDFHPVVGGWLNFSPDHLDWHPDLDHYRSSKARIWANMGPGDVAVANAEDPEVLAAARVPGANGSTVRLFGLHAGDWHLEGDLLVCPHHARGASRGPSAVSGSSTQAVPGSSAGDSEGSGASFRGILARSEMARSFPHDLLNGLAASAIATAAGASVEACREVLMSFRGLPHRVELVGEVGGVSYYDDSKATTPASVLAAMDAFEEVVLIAGGRNKGLDLSPLARCAPHLGAVVAIGEAASQVTRVLGGTTEVVEASSMPEAVLAASRLARPGGVVLLSPGCASFDWYGSYAERGEDFARCVRSLAMGAEAGREAGRGAGRGAGRDSRGSEEEAW